MSALQGNPFLLSLHQEVDAKTHLQGFRDKEPAPRYLQEQAYSSLPHPLARNDLYYLWTWRQESPFRDKLYNFDLVKIRSPGVSSHRKQTSKHHTTGARGKCFRNIAGVLNPPSAINGTPLEDKRRAIQKCTKLWNTNSCDHSSRAN